MGLTYSDGRPVPWQVLVMIPCGFLGVSAAAFGIMVAYSSRPEPEAMWVCGVIAAVLCIATFLTWRSLRHARRRQRLAEQQAQLALKFASGLDTPEIGVFNHQLYRTFRCSAGDDQSVISGSTTLGELSNHLYVRANQVTGAAAAATSCRGIQQAVQNLAPEAEVSTISDLNDAVPRQQLRELVIRLALLLRNPDIAEVPLWLRVAAGACALACTFAVVIALVFYLEQNVPAKELNPLLRGVAKIVVRGGFFVLLFLLARAFGLIAAKHALQLKPDCRQVCDLMWLQENAAADQTAEWQQEEVWQQVQTIATNCFGEQPLSAETPVFRLLRQRREVAMPMDV